MTDELQRKVDRAVKLIQQAGRDGMERKTNLKCIVMCKYTRRQVSHRYNALKRGYIIMEDCTEQGGERYNIYYDNETERAPIFEKNLLKDGFNLLKWQ